MSLVLSSFGKPVRDRMRVTQAESWERAAAIVAHERWGEDGQMERACGCCASGGWRREKELKMIELYVRRTRRFERRRSEETVV